MGTFFFFFFFFFFFGNTWINTITACILFYIKTYIRRKHILCLIQKYINLVGERPLKNLKFENFQIQFKKFLRFFNEIKTRINKTLRATKSIINNNSKSLGYKVKVKIWVFVIFSHFSQNPLTSLYHTGEKLYLCR